MPETSYLEGVLAGCQNHLSWLYLIKRCSGSSQSLSLVTVILFFQSLPTADSHGWGWKCRSASQLHYQLFLYCNGQKTESTTAEEGRLIDWPLWGDWYLVNLQDRNNVVNCVIMVKFFRNEKCSSNVQHVLHQYTTSLFSYSYIYVNIHLGQQFIPDP